MSETERTSLERLTQRWTAEGWRKGRVAMVDERHAPGFVDHDPAGRASDRQGFKQGISVRSAAFPDFHATIEDLSIKPHSGPPNPGHADLLPA